MNSADITKTTMAIFPAIFVNWFLEQKLTDYLQIFRKLIPMRWTFLNFTWKNTHNKQNTFVLENCEINFGGWLSYWVDTTVNWVTLANFSAATTHVAGSRSRRRLRGARAPSSSESRGMHTIHACLELCVVAAAGGGGGAWFSYAIEDVGLVLVLAHWCIHYIARTQWSAAASANIPYSA